jgi:uncharacterized membrane protein (UPF0127 family)
MRIVVFETPEEKAMGLQYKPFIEDQTLFVFPNVGYGDYFHSENVPEPFDIAFVDHRGTVIFTAVMHPPEDTVEVPRDAVMALEAKAGNMFGWGILPGTFFSL